MLNIPWTQFIILVIGIMGITVGVCIYVLKKDRDKAEFWILIVSSVLVLIGIVGTAVDTPIDKKAESGNTIPASSQVETISLSSTPQVLIEKQYGNNYEHRLYIWDVASGEWEWEEATPDLLVDLELYVTIIEFENIREDRVAALGIPGYHNEYAEITLENYGANRYVIRSTAGTYDLRIDYPGFFYAKTLEVLLEPAERVFYVLTVNSNSTISLD